MTQNDCRWCSRLGLPILPLRIAFVPGGLDNAPSAMVSANDRLAYPLREGKYMLRVVTEGYVYTYDVSNGGAWRCFAATSDGLFKELPIKSAPEEAPEFTCNRTGHNYDASVIDADNPNDSTELWVGYSRVWWTKSVLKQIANDADGVRSQLMTRIDPSALVEGGEVAGQDGFRLDSADVLEKHVAEYGAFDAIKQSYAARTPAHGIDRTDHAQPLVDRLTQIAPRGGVVLGLHDPVGLGREAAWWRNIQAGKLAEYETTQSDMRSRIVGDMILGLRNSMQDNGEAERWAERFAPKLDMAKLEQDKNDYESRKNELTRPIERASDDWVTITDRKLFRKAWRLYGGDEPACGLQLEGDFADCIEGSGALKKEQEWWQPWLVADPDDQEYPLWRALAAGDKDVVDFLKEQKGNGFELFKQAQSGLKEFREWLTKRRSDELVRGATDASGIIGMTIAGQVQRLVDSKPEHVQVVGARLRVIMAVRTDTMIRPLSTQISAKRMAVMLHETTWGPPRPSVSATVREAQRTLIRQSVDGAFLEGQFSSLRSLELDIWLPESAMKQADGSPLQLSNASQVAGYLEAPPLNPYAAMREYMSSAEGKIVGLGGALALFNLTSSLVSMGKALDEGGDDEGLQKAVFGLTSGVLSVGAIIGESVGSVMSGRVTASTAKSAATNLLARSVMLRVAGGLLGTFVALTDAARYWAQRRQALRDGDYDVANSYRRSAFLVVASGVSSAGAAIAAVQGTAAAASGSLASVIAGTIGGSGAGFLFGIPVWGWIAIAAVTLIASLYYVFRASQQEDTPLEIWCSRCLYRADSVYAGVRDKYLSASVEMEAFQNAVYGLRVTLDWQSEIGRDRLVVNVVMPGFGDTSDYAYQLTLAGSRPSVVLAHKSSAFSDDPELKPRPPSQQYAEAAPEPSWSDRVLSTVEGWLPQGSHARSAARYLREREPVQFDRGPFEPAVSFAQYDGYAVLSTEVLVDEDWYSRCGLKFEYWPDAVTKLDLKFSPVPGGASYRWTEDDGWIL